MEYTTQDIIAYLVEDDNMDFIDASESFMHQKHVLNYLMKKLGFIWKVQHICMTSLEMSARQAI